MLLTPPAARSLRALFDGEPTRYGLTPRERDVLRLMADGLQQKEIATRLHVSLATVTSHVHHLYAKLGVGTAAGAVGRALRERLI